MNRHKNEMRNTDVRIALCCARIETPNSAGINHLVALQLKYFIHFATKISCTDCALLFLFLFFAHSIFIG